MHWPVILSFLLAAAPTLANDFGLRRWNYELQDNELSLGHIDCKCPPGVPGPPGLIGTPGCDGPMGIQGIIGPVGDMGPMGPPGIAGINGLNGQNGAPGLPGAAGQPGTVGTVGTRGAMGPSGPPGPEGPRGWPRARLAVVNKAVKADATTPLEQFDEDEDQLGDLGVSNGENGMTDEKLDTHNGEREGISSTVAQI